MEGEFSSVLYMCDQNVVTKHIVISFLNYWQFSLVDCSYTSAHFEELNHDF